MKSMGEVTGTSKTALAMYGTRWPGHVHLPKHQGRRLRGGDRKFLAPVLSWNADSIVAKGIFSMPLSHIYKKELIKGVAEV